MHAHAAKVADCEARDFACLAVDSGDEVLAVGFQANTIADQRGEDEGEEAVHVSTIISMRKQSAGE